MQQSSSSQKLNFSAFKSSFTSNVVALKRRFSSGDLENEGYEEQAKEVISSVQPDAVPAPLPPVPPPSSKTISAPTSPSRSSSVNIFQKLQSSVSGVASNISSNIQQFTGTGLSGGVKIPYKDPTTLILLVIDDHNTDWSKYFKSKRIQNLEIQVEQCEFSEISVVAYESIVVASYIQYQTGVGRQLRQFIPDFLLIRQNLRDAGRDFKNALLAFMYAGLYSVNSLGAIYNFQDKPWVFAHMLAIQRKLGKDNFPIIEQNFYPNFNLMGGFVPRLPCVLKIGHAHGGLGKIRVPTTNDYADASSVVAVTGTYCTSEPYVEARCDVHIQKIGNQYKAFMRKGIVGHWKSSGGSTMLEQIPVTEKYRMWVDNVATLFGGLDVCALEVLVGKDGKEWIIEVNDSALSLMGETQEEDRRHIAELVLSRMTFVQEKEKERVKYRRQSVDGEDGPSGERNLRRESMGSTSSSTTSALPNAAASSIQSAASSAVSAAAQGVSSVSNKLFSRQNSQQAGAAGTETTPAASNTTATPTANATNTDSELDTGISNLKKTFAGIFGDM
ncbi:synapsin [Folsomia candida]|uniref:synapsin n=1 Tax=Folsomia candida TaxID=158441 RepID=UPI000B8F6C4D|nr:synapsin [Folsomia candida]